MKVVGLAILLTGFLGIGSTVGQGYIVEITIEDVRCGGVSDFTLMGGVISLGGISQSFGTPILPETFFTHTFSSKPSEVVAFDLFFDSGPCGLDFNKTKAIFLTSSTACDNINYVLNSNFDLDFSVTWTPEIFEMDPFLSSPPDCYFTDETITLAATPGYQDYAWEYSAGNDPFQTFSNNPGNSNSITFNWDDVFGATVVPNTTVLFRSVLGNCTAPAAGNYQVGGAPRPLISIAGTQAISACSNNSNGEIRASIDRLVLPNETITFGLYNQNNFASIITSKTDFDLDGREIFAGLDPGTYYFLIESTLTYCGDVVFSEGIAIDGLGPISFTLSSPSPVNCSDDKSSIAILSPMGGTGIGYEYSKDNGTTWQSDPSFINLDPGTTYEFMIHDSRGCESSVITNATPSAPESISASFVITQETCSGLNNGKVEIFPSGGTSPYTFSKSLSEPFTSMNLLNNYTSGDHEAWIKDVNGCLYSLSFTIIAANPLTISVSTTQTSCFDALGTINVVVSGGVGSFTHSIDGLTYQASPNFAAPAGNYIVFVMDINGCMASLINVTIANSLSIEYDVISNNISCAGLSDGALVIQSPSNGLPPFYYSFDGGINYSDSNTSTDLAAGTYNLAVKDNNGCISFQTAVLIQPALVSATFVETKISCFGDDSGELEVIPSGGSGSGFSYLWSNGATTSKISNLIAGNYDVVITDGDGCGSGLMEFNLSQPATIEIEETITLPSCDGRNDAAIEVSMLGGIEPYTYVWSTGVATKDLQNVATGNYSLTVTDFNGCAVSQSITIAEAVPVKIEFDDKVICGGQAYIFDPGFDALAYTWTSSNGFSSTDRIINLTEPGLYQLEFIDNNGCAGSGSFSLSFSDELLTADFLMASEVFAGDSVIMIDISWPLPDSVKWVLPPEGQVVNNTVDYAILIFNEPGTYEIGLYAHRANCSAFYSAYINVLEADFAKGGRFSASEEKLIRSFDVYPNPNNGYFTSLIALANIADIQIQLIDLATNRIILTKKSQNMDMYDFDFFLPNLTSGTYALTLQAGGETSIVRMIIQ